MVKYRGINVSIVSQFDIRKLPEFSPCERNDPFHHHQEVPTLRSDNNSVASCYVPIYPGSQIWFEYSVDAPHPPDASYLFKMLHNGQLVTSWDCTAKHGYRGNMFYNIQYVGNDNLTGMPLVQRQAFRFTTTDGRNDVGAFDDCIEVRVHRIEHRQRARLEAPTNNAEPPRNGASDGLSLVNSGFLKPGSPQRRYRYQLLDPTDEPYATIRFYYRSYALLEEYGIVSSPTRPTLSSAASSSAEFSEYSILPAGQKNAYVHEQSHPPSDSPRTILATSPTPPQGFDIQLVDEDKLKASPESETMTLPTLDLPHNSYEESLHIMAKDSLENLHGCPPDRQDEDPIQPVTYAGVAAKEGKEDVTSPKKLQKKSLKLQIDGANFELEKEKRSPMSPFTSAGVLRRMMSPTPPSAPAAVTEFGPTIADEVEAQIAKEREHRKIDEAQMRRIDTTRTERGGKMLLGFLGKRIGRTEY